MINTVVVYMYTRGRARQNWQLRLKLPNNTEVFLQKKKRRFFPNFFHKKRLNLTTIYSQHFLKCTNDVLYCEIVKFYFNDDNR